MGVAELPVIARSTQKADIWLNEIKATIATDDDHLAYRALRGFLITLRDRLTADEAADFAAQLPVVLRGVFFEGFKPSRVPETYRDARGFLERFAEMANLDDDSDGASIARACAQVARQQLTDGAFDDAIDQLPEEIQKLLDSPS